MKSERFQGGNCSDEIKSSEYRIVKTMSKYNFRCILRRFHLDFPKKNFISIAFDLFSCGFLLAFRELLENRLGFYGSVCIYSLSMKSERFQGGNRSDEIKILEIFIVKVVYRYNFSQYTTTVFIWISLKKLSFQLL
jgi:hypothetical protein